MGKLEEVKEDSLRSAILGSGRPSIRQMWLLCFSIVYYVCGLGPSEPLCPHLSIGDKESPHRGVVRRTKVYVQ